MRIFFCLFLATGLLSACHPNSSGALSPSSSLVDPGSSSSPPSLPPEDPPPPASRNPIQDDSVLALDAFAEKFATQIAAPLKHAKYMEESCSVKLDFSGWEKFPIHYCRYRSDGQTAEVAMLNPGPRQLTQWIQNACEAYSANLARCMDKTFRHILGQSGGQFPVAGIVVEDMDGNGKGNLYVFRNGVTVLIDTIETGSETPLTKKQQANSFIAQVRQTYSYARPVSLSREQMTAYAQIEKIQIPDLGTSSERKNNWNEVVRLLYQQAWGQEANHLIRAWVFSQDL